MLIYDLLVSDLDDFDPINWDSLSVASFFDPVFGWSSFSKDLFVIPLDHSVILLTCIKR